MSASTIPTKESRVVSLTHAGKALESQRAYGVVIAVAAHLRAQISNLDNHSRSIVQANVLRSIQSKMEQSETQIQHEVGMRWEYIRCEGYHRLS